MRKINMFTLRKLFNEQDDQLDFRQFQKRLESIDLGLSAEEEFMSLLVWLGCCKRVNKLENIGFSSDQSVEIAIPDLVCELTTENESRTFLIEIKSSTDNKLKWTETYFHAMKEYGHSLGKDVLVAWKNPQIGFWTLNTLDSFVKTNKTYSISFEESMVENLLGRLAGDFAFVLNENLQVTFVFDKVELVDTDGVTGEENWKTTLSDFFVLDQDGKENRDIPIEFWTVLMTTDFTQSTVVSDMKIVQNFFLERETAESMTFMQRVLINYVKGNLDSEVSGVPWSKLLRERKLPSPASKILKTMQGMFGKYVRYIFTFEPKSELLRERYRSAKI